MIRILLLSVFLFLLVPFAASAGSLLYDDVTLTGTWSPSEMWNGTSWVDKANVDLDGRVNDPLDNYPLDGVLQEMFCVSINTWRSGETYDLYTIDSSTPIAVNDWAKFQAAVWIADNYTTYSFADSPLPFTQDQRKGIAQRAIWNTLGIGTSWGLQNVHVSDIESFAATVGSVDTSNWLLALNVSEPQGQSFLVSVPEPATLLLLGTGLLGIAIVGRKRQFKK